MMVFPEVCNLPGVEGGYYSIKANLRWPPLSLTKPLRIPRLELGENENQAARARVAGGWTVSTRHNHPPTTGGKCARRDSL